MTYDYGEKLPETVKLSVEDMGRWVEAIRHLPTEPVYLLEWINGPLKQFFPFEKVICVHGELIAGQIVVTHWLAVGFTEDQQAHQTSSFETGQRGALASWLMDRKPFYIDPENPPACATDFELEEMRRFEMGCIAAHGVLSLKANSGTYFSFAGISPPLSGWHLDALRLIAPTLNDLFLAKIANTQTHEKHLKVLSPRQRIIVRHLVAGFDNKAIAKSMGITEKTVRNQLSEVYVVFNIHTRSQLQALLR